MEREIEKLKDSLSYFGFSEKEIDVYVSLLQRGETSVYALARRSGVKPSTTYVILDSLIGKGAVIKIPKNRKDIFTAKPLEQLLYTLKLRVAGLENIAESFRQAKGKSEILFYEGLNPIKKLLLENSTLQKNSEIVGFYGSAEHVSPELEEIFKKQNKIRSEFNVPVRAIAPKSESLQEWRATDKILNRKIKVVTGNLYSSNISIDIEKEKVVIVDLQKEKAISIKDEDFARTFKQIFELVWGNPNI